MLAGFGGEQCLTVAPCMKRVHGSRGLPLREPREAEHTGFFEMTFFIEGDMRSMEEYTLQVPSIGCQGCMTKIVKQLQTLPGVEVVETMVATKSLLLHYVPQEISVTQIDDAVRAIGHRVAANETDLAGTGS